MKHASLERNATNTHILNYAIMIMLRDAILQANGVMKRNSVEKFRINYSEPLKHDQIEVKNKQIPILIFEEVRGRGCERMMTTERDTWKATTYIIQHKQYMQGE